jgi:hypothetical protein
MTTFKFLQTNGIASPITFLQVSYFHNSTEVKIVWSCIFVVYVCIVVHNEVQLQLVLCLLGSDGRHGPERQLCW